MKTILYFQPSGKTSAPDKLAGVLEIAARNGCHVQVIEEHPTRKLLAELVDFWHPLGAIANCGGDLGQLDASVFGKLPAVFIGHDPATLPRRCPNVIHDQAATARLTARELRPCAEYLLYVAGNVLRGTHDERTHRVADDDLRHCLASDAKRRGRQEKSRAHRRNRQYAVSSQPHRSQA